MFIVDSCSSNPSQLLFVVSPVLRQVTEPLLELLIEKTFRALAKKEADPFVLKAYRDIYRADRGRHTVEQAYGTLIQAEIGLKDPNLGTYNQFPAAISSSQQCKTPAITSPGLYLLVFATDTS